MNHKAKPIDVLAIIVVGTLMMLFVTYAGVMLLLSPFMSIPKADGFKIACGINLLTFPLSILVHKRSS